MTGSANDNLLPAPERLRQTLWLDVTAEPGVMPGADDGADPAARAERIAQAAALLRAGKLVAFPTETVYGLGADATNAEAVAGIFAAKGRPYSDPLIVHIADASWLARVARDVPPLALAVAARFWPGPLTLVLPRAKGIPPVVAAGGDTVGVRAPSHPIAQQLLRLADKPVAAPSANRFMGVSPTTARHVLADLDGRIDAILDGGPTSVGVESTVIDLTRQPPRILRPGGVTLEALRAVIPDIQAPTPGPSPAGRGGIVGRDGAPSAGDAASEAAGEVLRAPGQLARHYAPQTRLIVFDAAGERGRMTVLAAVRAALARGERVGALATDDEAPALEALGARVARLGPADDLGAVAQRLYAALRSLDDGQVDVMVAHTFGQEGMGLALWDRLRRAAGGRLEPADE